VPFGPDEAAEAARLYDRVPLSRGREIDLAIAACAILREAELLTLNASDFDDILNLRLTPT
jgi:predicted nucleic acid-binding protein